MPRIIDGSTMNMTGQKIKQYRKERKMSQQQLSIKLETLAVYICRGSISRIEDGDYFTPRDPGLSFAQTH